MAGTFAACCSIWFTCLTLPSDMRMDGDSCMRRVSAGELGSCKVMGRSSSVSVELFGVSSPVGFDPSPSTSSRGLWNLSVESC